MYNNKNFFFFFYILTVINYFFDFSNEEILAMFIFLFSFFYTKKNLYFFLFSFLYLIVFCNEVYGGYGSRFFINFVFFNAVVFLFFYLVFSKIFKLNKKNKETYVYSVFALNLFYILFPSVFFDLYYLKLFI
jgi:hypothetical protein